MNREPGDLPARVAVVDGQGTDSVRTAKQYNVGLAHGDFPYSGAGRREPALENMVDAAKAARAALVQPA